MKYVFIGIALLSTACTTPFASTFAIFEEQCKREQYAQHVSNFNALINSTIRDAEITCKQLNHWLACACVPQIRGGPFGQAELLRKQHARLTALYDEFNQAPYAQEHCEQFARMQRALATLNAHVSTVSAAELILHTQLPQSAHK